ncbi:MAG: glycine oxidase ThiO [Planctomycetaceae bacterium]|nr:glycine oxidase ThiO [Planctomycetaceae bacterium]MBP60777.1 glycine oxidase ThiO [Planctomycetaceae bacterium]
MIECLIIGGGVIGLSLAYEMARKGQKVRVLERNEPGQEASWAGAGILSTANLDTATDPYERLRGLSTQLHSRWADELRAETGIDNGYHCCGEIRIARSEEEHANLRETLKWHSRHNIPARELTPQELLELEPKLSFPIHQNQILSALHLPLGTQVRNPRHLQALISACLKRGVEISPGTVVEDFEIRRGRVEAVKSTTLTIRAKNICFTSGAWSRPLLERVGVSLKLKPIRGQMVLFKAPKRFFEPIISEGPRYIVPRRDGRILAGSTEEDVGYVKQNTPSGVSELTRFAVGLVEDLAQVPVERTWSGLRPSSPDGKPILGRVADLENAFLATGHFRSGLFLSTGTAVVLQQLISGEQPEIDLTPFQMDRS